MLCHWQLRRSLSSALYHHIPPSLCLISLDTNSSSICYISSIPNMSQPSSTSSFQSLFNVALQDYANQTGTKLVDHPFAEQLEKCDSVDSMSLVLQEHARRFCEFRGEDGKIMKSLKCAVQVLYKLSTSTVLGEGIGIVSPKSLISTLYP
jgi:hypothetical protein